MFNDSEGIKHNQQFRLSIAKKQREKMMNIQRILNQEKESKMSEEHFLIQCKSTSTSTEEKISAWARRMKNTFTKTATEERELEIMIG